MTVSGPVASQCLGHVLPHEHVLVNLIPEYRASGGLLNDLPRMAEELNAFRTSGGSTLVELTPSELTAGAAADPLGLYAPAAMRALLKNHPADAAEPSSGRNSVNALELRKLSEASGVNIIIGTGHYRDPYLDKEWFDRNSVDQIAEGLVAELVTGVRGTDVRAGIIGEIGTDRWYMSAAEERSFRAAARAHNATGAAITTHAARWPVGILQLDLLTSEGVDPRRVIIGHCDSVNIPEYHRDLARRGAFVQFDLIRGSAPEWQTATRVQFVVDLVRQGLLDQILLSHDVCAPAHLKTGGDWGYTFVGTGFRERLIAAGLEDEEVHQILVGNPQRALSGT